MIAKARKQDVNLDVLQAGYGYHSLPGRLGGSSHVNVYRGYVSMPREGFQHCEIQVTVGYDCDFKLTWQSNTTQRDYCHAGGWYAFHVECDLSVSRIGEKLGLVLKVVKAIEAKLGGEAQPEAVAGMLDKMGFTEVVRDNRIGEDVEAASVLPTEYTGWATRPYADRAVLWARAIAVNEDGARAAIMLDIAGEGGQSEYARKAQAWRDTGMDVYPYDGDCPETFQAALAAHRVRYGLPSWEEEVKAKKSA